MIKIRLKYVDNEKLSKDELHNEAKKLKRIIKTKFKAECIVDVKKGIIEIKNIKRPFGERENHINKKEREKLVVFLRRYYSIFPRILANVGDE